MGGRATRGGPGPERSPRAADSKDNPSVTSMWLQPHREAGKKGAEKQLRSVYLKGGFHLLWMNSTVLS